MAKITVLVRIDLLYEILEAEPSTTQPGLAESTHQSTISKAIAVHSTKTKRLKALYLWLRVSATARERESKEYISVTALEL